MAPCEEFKGDCDSDSECEGDLLCGANNCVGPLFDSQDDCCYRPNSGITITTGTSRKVNLTHSAHAAYGYAELVSDSSVRLTELYYDGAGSQK